MRLRKNSRFDFLAKRKVKYCAVQFVELKNSIRSIRETWPKKKGRYVSRRTKRCEMRVDKSGKRNGVI